MQFNAASLRAARERRGLSRQALCDRVNDLGHDVQRWGRPANHLTYSYICKLEQGQRTDASPEILAAIAQVLSVDTDALLAPVRVDA